MVRPRNDTGSITVNVGAGAGGLLLLAAVPMAGGTACIKHTLTTV